VTPAGDALSWLMPRYELDDEAFEALEAYLRTLPGGDGKGVDSEAVHFATVVTPDATADAVQTMLEVLRACIDERMEGERADGVTRAWSLDVWRLQGDRSTWKEQLQAAYARRPAFAIVSGISGGTWAPVDRFCEESRVPCLFPNTDLPQAQGGYWSMYLSAGVELEARVVARDIAAARPAPSRVVQVHREGTNGAAAARALSAALAATGVRTETRVIPPGGALSARDLESAPRDSLVLWLGTDDIAQLPQTPPSAARVYVSGTLAGFEEAPLAPAWREHVSMTYPIELPAARHARHAYTLEPWLSEHHIAPGDKRLQGNTLAACNLLAEGMARIRDVYAPRYLMESIEISMGNAAAATPFPRFSLAAGQRFGSKGAYLVKPGAADRTVEPIGDWIVP
jgi:hypothetical protein